MKLKYIKIFFATLLCTLSAMTAWSNNDGLYFNSHSFTTSHRTTLLLNAGKSISIDDGFTMSFDMDLRRGEPFFGNIFCIKADDGTHIDAMLSMPAEGVSKPGLVVNGSLRYVNANVRAGNNIKVKIFIDKKNGKIVYSYGGHSVTVPVSIKSSSAKILFGMHLNDINYVDVAPINVRNIRIAYDGENKYIWTLRQHQDSIAEDEVSQSKATAINGHWILDDHVLWKVVYSYDTKDRTQVTYNPLENLFYIVADKSIVCFNPKTNATKTIKVNGGFRATPYSDYIAFNSKNNSLYTYNIKGSLFSYFNFSTGRWSLDKNITEEPGEYNHAWAVANDTTVYMFGGYGYYKCKNTLWRLNPVKGTITELDYSPKITPRTGAAMAVVGNKLYIFGGYGNETGEQELPFSYYYDLTCIDLKTMKAETLWSTEGEQQDVSFQLAPQMIYNSSDNSFYAVTSYRGGRIIKIFIKKAGWKVVTEAMRIPFDYQDMAIGLYPDYKDGKIYVVVDGRLNNLKHRIKICSIDLPIQDNYIPKPFGPKEKAEAKRKRLSWMWLLLLIIPAGAVVYVVARRKKKGDGKASDDESIQAEASAEPSETEAVPSENNNKTETSTEKEEIKTVEEEEENEEAKPQKKYYNPAGGAIYLLGKFAVHDAKGKDITALFTPRARNLLFVLLLYSERDGKGIEIQQLDEALWQDMSEDAARNNRNVYIRKLRILLRKIGDIEIVNDKIHYRIEFHSNVFFDYHEALKMMELMKEDDSEETTARTLELLFAGPLLPTHSFEWLDKFKSDYSNSVLSLLTRQLRHAQQDGNDDLAMKIANTILTHDPFNDSALAAKCSILTRRHKTGIAKNVYDNFCKNYEECMAEKYPHSFAEVCK